MQLTAAERRALDALDHDALVAGLLDLVRIPSVSGTAAECEVQHHVAGQLDEAGLDVDLWSLDLPTLAREPGFPGAEVERAEAYGVAATSAGEGDPALVLCGHSDVVPIGDAARWEGIDPFAAEIRGDAVVGRGSCDMKGGLAAALAAARALQRSGLAFERPYAVHSVVGEEDGGLGAYATLRRGHGGEACVIPEPTSNRVLTACAGSLTFRLEVPGRAAHGSARLEGVSAVEAYWPLHLAMRELEAARNAEADPLFDGNPLPYGISVGRVEAGDWASSVPDRLVAEGRFGVRLGEDVEQARSAFGTAIARACAEDGWLRDHPARLTWPGGEFASGRTPSDHPLVVGARAAIAEVIGVEAPLAAGPYGSDLRLYTAAGIPTIHYGPGDIAMAHAPRERVPIPEVIRTAEVLTLLAVRRCGGHL